jgi:hypothetical protein
MMTVREGIFANGRYFALKAAVAALCLCVTAAGSVAAQSSTRVWFAKAGADGDGSSAARPLGSAAALEAASGAGDLIVLLPSDAAFDGGIALECVPGLAPSMRREP